MRKRRKIFGVITVLWVGVIFSFSLQTGEDSGEMSMAVLTHVLELFFGTCSPAELDVWHLVLRKCAHFSEYMILGIFSMLTCLQIEWKRCIIRTFAFCGGIAILDEILQLFVSGRVGNAVDVLIDSAGAFVGIVLVFAFARWVSNKKRHSI